MNNTNNYNLPEALFETLKNQSYKPNESRISVSDLINPPLIRSLKLKYWDELTEDVSERLWALLGTAIHSVLQKHVDDNTLAEEKLKQNVDGIDVVGKIDVYADGNVEDYKVTSVYSFLLGDKIEWERQLNVYAWLFRKDGFPVYNLIIHAILRDWQKSKLKTEQDYPPIPFLSKPIPLWTFEEQEKYVKERVALFKADPLPCTDEERWMRGGNVALMQEGKKRAIKLFTKEEAKKITLSKGQYLEDRPAEAIRCLYYCPVRSVCKYNKEV